MVFRDERGDGGKYQCRYSSLPRRLGRPALSRRTRPRLRRARPLWRVGVLWGVCVVGSDEVGGDGRWEVLRSRLRGWVMEVVGGFRLLDDEVRVGAIIFGPCCAFGFCGVT